MRGFLQEIKFQPGQKVNQNDELYIIEKDMYEADVNSAKAAVASAEAAIGVAEATIRIAEAEVEKTKQDLSREERLKEQNASSQAQYDAAVAAADGAAASLESAKAQLEAAKAEKGSAEATLERASLDLGYTTVRAPITGRITKTNYKLGNLVDNGSHLTTIVDDDQIFANFSISDRNLLTFMKARRAAMGAGATDDDFDEREWRDSPVFLARETDDGFPFEGKLDYVDQAGVQSETGTLGLRATFENPVGQLVPGLFITVRLPAAGEEYPSLVIPEAATLRDQLGSYVLTVGNDDKVQKTRITAPLAVSGWAIVTDGLDSSSRVIIVGQQRAREGLAVTISEEKPLEVDAMTLMRGMSPSSDEPDSSAGQDDSSEDNGSEGPSPSSESGEQEQAGQAPQED